MRAQLRLATLLPGRRIPRLLSRLLSGEDPEADLPTLPASRSWPQLVESDLPDIQGEVYLLEGCAMRVLYPQVHEATRRLLRRIGYVVKDVPQGCCGALHAHNGYLDTASEMRQRLVNKLSNSIPIIVDSAGCGSWLKEMGTGRVFDASEFLADHGLEDQLFKSHLNKTVTYHDACHLAHGQGIRSAPRKLLKAIPGLKLVELAESDMCCGSAGIYNVTQPKMARELLERKWRNVLASGAEIVALGNPGCHAWIAQAAREHASPIQVLHTIEVLESAFNSSTA